MGVRRFDIEAGGTDFTFLGETEPKIDFWLGKYPDDRKRSAVIPLLWLAQKDNGGWLSEPAMRAVADRLEMPYIRVYEVATFYTMFRLQPVGRFHVQICGTTPCMLRGANDLKTVAEQKIGKKMTVTDDGKLSWEEVECLGACVNAPMVQINDYYYEDLTDAVFTEILDKLRNGVPVAPGVFVDRQRSGPEGGLTSLTDETLFDGSRAAPLAGGLPNLPSAAAAHEDQAAAPVKPVPAVKPEAAAGKTTLIDANRPETLEAAPDTPDDLKRIKGIGPKNEEALNALGIYTFRQIADWTPDNVDWVEGSLSFPGRIGREDWISQAKVLADGGETEFAKRVDAGEVESSKPGGES
ncbi:MAG: NADH-quinone oxidoreductase subunit NuoE [Pseudomonadota bacterium]